MARAFVTRRPVFTSILVAVDDSEPAGWAADYAIRLAKELRAKVSLVHVVPPPLADAAVAFAQTAILKLAAEDDPVLGRARTKVPDRLFSKLLLREGEPANQVIEAARELPADLVVIGTHGRGLLGRFLLGSTAEAVVRGAPCPVLTVSRPPGAETVATAAKPQPYEVAQPAAAEMG